MNRPFKVLGIQQVAIGGDDKDKLRKFWVDMMGLKMTHSFTSEKENVDEDVLQIGEGATAVEVDIMQCLDPERKPKVNEPKLNHIGLWIDNLPKAVEWLTSQGVRFGFTFDQLPNEKAIKVNTVNAVDHTLCSLYSP